MDCCNTIPLLLFQWVIDMLYQVFAVYKSTGTALSDPFYIKAPSYITAFALAENMFSQSLKIVSCLPEQDHI